MNGQSASIYYGGYRRVGRSGPWLVLLLVAPVAVFLGLVAVFLPWFILIPAFLVPLFIAAAWWRPEYAMAIMVTVLGGFLPDFLLPSLPFLGGTLRTQDIFLFFVALICILKHGTDFARWWPGLRPFAAPLAALLLIVAFNVVYSKLVRGNATPGIIEELRPFVFFTLPLWLVMMIDSPSALRRLFWALIVGATLLAIAQIVQATTALHIIHGSRLEDATVGGNDVSGVIRSTVPGVYLMIFALLAVVARYLAGRQGLLTVSSLCSIYAGALLFTFGRALWGATLLGLFLVAWSFGGVRLLRFVVVMAVVGMVAVGGVTVFKPETADTMYERALSVKDEGSARTSLGWRLEENRLAWARIRQQPLVGIGLGGVYKPFSLEADWEGESRTTHNSHVFIQLKLGAVGSVTLAWLLLVYWRQAGRLLRSMPKTDLGRPLVVAMRVMLSMVLITALIRPEWSEPATVALVSLAIGLLAAMANLVNGQHTNVKVEPAPAILYAARRRFA